jgi:spore germination protein KB
MENGKISARQMGIMMFPTIVSTVVLVVPSTSGGFAKNDLWLSPIWASFLGFLAVYVAYRLHQLYPKETVIQYSESILGKISGKIVGFLFISFTLFTTGVILRGYAEFIVSTFLVQTPISVIIFTMLVICFFAVRGGVEVIARMSELLIPIYLLSFVIIILLPMSDFDLRNVLPIMEHGIGPSFMGALVPAGWFTEFFLMSYLLPFLTDVEKGKKWGMISVFFTMLIMVVTNLAALFLFGVNTESYLYPLLFIARYVSIADFIENLESIVMVLWVLGIFLKVTFFYYVTVLGTAQWLQLIDYRSVIFPLGFLIGVFSFWDLPNVAEINRYNTVSSVSYLPVIQLLIPLLLLLIGFIRTKSGKEKRERPS